MSTLSTRPSLACRVAKAISSRVAVGRSIKVCTIGRCGASSHWRTTRSSCIPASENVQTVAKSSIPT